VVRLRNSWKRKSQEQQKEKNEVGLSINDETIIDYLEELAEKFGIQIRDEAIKQENDLPYVAGKPFSLYSADLCALV
jgi:hypothetical protein